ncbi:MAG: hypothetical protein ACRCWM_12770 [Sarcina sp.]
MAVCNTMENYFVVPNDFGCEVIILTDKEMNYGIMNIDDNTLALSSDAIRLLNEAFFMKYPSKVSDLNSTGDNQINNFLEDMSSQRLIGLTSNPQTLEYHTSYCVEAGDIINKNSIDECISESPIIAEYAGCVICIKIGTIYLYIYFSDTSLLDLNCDEEILGYSGVLDFGSLGTTIIPESINSVLGANCSVCGLCTGCGACASCSLCSGVNSSASAISLVTVNSALSVTSAASSFIINRP